MKHIRNDNTPTYVIIFGLAVALMLYFTFLGIFRLESLEEQKARTMRDYQRDYQRHVYYLALQRIHKRNEDREHNELWKEIELVKKEDILKNTTQQQNFGWHRDEFNEIMFHI